MRKKVVIIDDEEDLCKLMCNYLLDLNYDVHMAHTLTSGLHLTEQVKPDIIFLDNNLPDGLGWDKMPLFKQKFPTCKINLISAYRYVPTALKPDDTTVKIIEKPLRLNLLREYL
jgi:DNA-binding NtrC family response regulator